MKIKLNKKNILLIILMLVLAGGIISAVYLNNSKKDSMPSAIEREYIAEKRNITVGVDATGQIELSQNQLTLPSGITIKDVLVEIGDEVKIGDDLITINTKKTSEKLIELQTKRAEAEKTLKLENDNKANSHSQSDLKINDIRYQTKKAYDDARLTIVQNITTLDAQIAQLKSEIENLESQQGKITTDENQTANNNENTDENSTTTVLTSGSNLQNQINELKNKLSILQAELIVKNGTISINDRNINKINTSDLRDMESFVTQDTHLFQDTIKNNVKIARINASDEEVITACKKASIHEIIVKLPNGYDTQVGELGDTLSGGEKQRIGLARAFLHNAPFILLDEPTSNLDSLNEAVILQSIKKERAGKTVVLISHRESTMRIADKVYSVENGRTS